jgi:hypothetical protein
MGSKRETAIMVVNHHNVKSMLENDEHDFHPQKAVKLIIGNSTEFNSPPLAIMTRKRV